MTTSAALARSAAIIDARWSVETIGHHMRVVESVDPATGFGDDLVAVGSVHDPAARKLARLVAALPDVLRMGRAA